MGYTRMTKEERIIIHRQLQAGVGNNAIARLLKRDKGTISRELKRNAGLRGYRPDQAHEKARERARRPGSRRFTDAVRLDVQSRLREWQTPEMICARARLEGRPHVCKETVYKHVYADAKRGGDLWRFLPRSRRKRKRRIPRRAGRGRGLIPGRRGIETRPAEVETRALAGHWEGDLINGARGSGHLLTLVERKHRFALVGKTATKDAGEVCRETVARFAQVPPELRLSCTCDNGKEFARHAEIASLTGMDVYFARPYHSWERGSNENLNGLVRRLHPKGASFAHFGEAELTRIERFLNDRPRKCLGWLTPRESMALETARLAGGSNPRRNL